MELTLEIKTPYLRKYLEYIFEKKDGIFMVNRRQDFGKLICSLFQKSEMPVPTEKMEQTVRLMLPKKSNLKSEATKYWLYFSKSDTGKLNDYLKAIFELDFREYYLAGRKQNMMQKDIIDAFIVSRKFIDEDISLNDMITKRIYREDEKNLAIIRNKFIEKAKSIDKKINKILVIK